MQPELTIFWWVSLKGFVDSIQVPPLSINKMIYFSFYWKILILKQLIMNSNLTYFVFFLSKHLNFFKLINVHKSFLSIFYFFLTFVCWIDMLRISPIFVIRFFFNFLKTNANEIKKTTLRHRWIRLIWSTL